MFSLGFLDFFSNSLSLGLDLDSDLLKLELDLLDFLFSFSYKTKDKIRQLFVPHCSCTITWFISPTG
jgi:hypothetical protein